MIVYVPNSLILHVNKSSCERECAPTRHGTGEGAGPAPTCVPQWHSRNATSRMTRHHIRLPSLNACRLKSSPPLARVSHENAPSSEKTQRLQNPPPPTASNIPPTNPTQDPTPRPPITPPPTLVAQTYALTDVRRRGTLRAAM